MNWKALESIKQLEGIITTSHQNPVVIFKHSTRCSISHTALSRIERDYKESSIDFYYLDLLTYRPVSNEIENRLNVTHQSPQVILIKNGKAIYDASHLSIVFEDLIKFSTAA